ncbi:putative aldehyde dehydrogenase [Stipitochalara longipes BDJ]|nr:putative aldehyde dehydrogenase [Stipitochalara longipes BDJ]
MSNSEVETRLFINNEYVKSSNANPLTIRNPFDDSIVTSNLEVAEEKEVDAAVNAAKYAYTKGPWSKFTGAQRSACLLKFADLVEQNMEKLAYLETIAMGKPISVLLRVDIPHMIGCYRSDKIEGDSFAADDGVYKIVRHEPLGVCAGIASWNATFLYAAWKIAPALAAGNTFIFKASEKAPLAMLSMAGLYKEAGFPPGVIQFLSGGGHTGALLSSHKQIAKISITGSIGAGIKVQEQATKSNLKKVVLELGGKSPAIVFSDTDFELALGSCSHGFLFNSGQICAAASRCYVQEDIAPKFIESMKAEFEQAASVLGADPLERTTVLGPLADKAQFDRVLSFVAAGSKSAKLLTGGKRKGERGYFFEPTIFLEPADDNPAYKEEIFGPVLVIKTFKTEEEVIELANNTDFGLAACIYTSNLDRALRVSSAIESGAVSINGPMVPSYQTPFGGFKQSGIGKELGKYGLLEYTKTKTVHIK